MTQIEYTPAEVIRFWSYVDRNGPIPEHRPELGRCWLWTRAKAVSYGYGIFGPSLKRVYRAHRFSWIVTYGEIPDGLFVLHHCDVPPCVRPDHLFLGTQKANVRDCVAKGRFKVVQGPRGATHHSAKLTEDQVRAIRRRAANGEQQRLLSREYSVSDAVISKVVLRQIWKHVLEEPHQSSSQDES